MSEIIIPGTYGNAVMKWNQAGVGKDFTCTLGYSVATPGTQTASDSADSIYDALTASGSICTPGTMDESWTFIGVDVYQNEGGTLHGGSSSGPAVVGTHTGNGLPLVNNSAVLVRKRTPLIGKRQRGRMYLPGLNVGTSSVDSSGNLTSGKLGQLQAIVGVFLTEISASPTRPYLLHSHVDDTPTIITDLSVGGQVGTQRRRLR